MKEFDFDELDRAVSSLMKNEPGSVPVKADDEVKTVTLPDSVAPVDDSMPVSTTKSLPVPDDSEAIAKTFSPSPAEVEQKNEESEVARSVTDEQPAESTPAVDEPAETALPSITTTHDVETQPKQSTVPHRKGRFMDVKHDASSMRTGAMPSQVTPRAPTKPASREGVTVQPSDHTADGATAPTAPLIDDVTPVAPPSPLENDAIPTPDTDTLESQSSSSNSVEQTDTQTEVDYSAFIPDAKVEKRPLGQPVVSSPTPLDTTVAGDPVSDSVTDQAEMNNSDVGTPASPDTALSAEYDQHLMAIESGDASQGEALVVPTTELEPSSSDIASDHVTALASTSTTGPASIQQQYKEEPSSGDQTNGAIYDTASYHQPLKHPEKKKSGMLWVVLIVIVILAGVGGGAFVYLNGM